MVGQDLGLPQVVTGVLGIVVGAILGYSAWRIAKRQKNMQEEQPEFFTEQLSTLRPRRRPLHPEDFSV